MYMYKIKGLLYHSWLFCAAFVYATDIGDVDCSCYSHLADIALCGRAAIVEAVWCGRIETKADDD